MKSIVKLTRYLLLSLLSMVTLAAGTPGERPNIVIILADDVGWSDLGCMGSEIDTPNLDSLAGNGIRFTQFYNAARCCPTRASLLTGLYPHRTGVGHMVEDEGKEGYRGDLNSRCATIADALRPAGYKNYAVGKWHVTKHVGPNGPKDNWPLQRGFDRYYGTIRGAGSYFDPSTLTRDNTAISAFADPEYRSTNYYYTDAITDHATRFIREHEPAAPDRPFLLYVAYTAAHWPLHALPQDIARQHGKYDHGYKPVIAARVAKQKALGLIETNWSATPDVGDWDKVRNKRWEAACMEVYAAQLECMDRGVGRIVEELKRTGQLDNTLILFLQDNGACAEPQGRSASARHPEVRPDKAAYPAMKPGELFPPESAPLQTREGFPVLMGKRELPGPADTFMAYGQSWAHVSNTPFREYKSWVHEGGIATPLIAHWPKGIPSARRGGLEKQPGHIVDIMATCLDVAGAKYPPGNNGETLYPLAGVSLKPAFEGKAVVRTAPICWEHEGNRAIRDGPWKLVAKSANGKWELYDIESDRTEMHDLAAANPEIARRLAAQWESWACALGVLPWIWKTAYSNSIPTAAKPATAKRSIPEAGKTSRKDLGMRWPFAPTGQPIPPKDLAKTVYDPAVLGDYEPKSIS